MKKKITAVILSVATILLSIATCAVTSFAEAEGFLDVPDGTWYTEGVIYCAENGYMSGTGGGYFSPDAPLTRAMIVTILARVDGADLSGYAGKSSFDDVSPDAWYAAPVEWAYSSGCTSGVGDGKFAPDAPLTREQLAVILCAFSTKNGNGWKPENTLWYYRDAILVSSWAENAVKWAVDGGFLSGTGFALLSPGAPCTRAQIALIIKKYVGFINSDCEHEWTDPSCTEGRVCKICGYTRGTPNGHSAIITCTHGGKCKVCGKSVAPFGHLYTDKATCTSGVACAICGEVSAPLGHSYPGEPTCTESVKCTRCGNVKPALGHTTTDGICSRCGKRIYPKTTSKGYGMYYSGGAWHVVCGSDDIIIANKSYALDKTYNPGGIVSSAQSAFNNLQSAARKKGLSIRIVSGFRSYSYQTSLYNRYAARDGKAEADRYSARPGHSEHQTGLAMDVNSVDQSFQYTDEGRWLAAHAHEYGFIIRYPKGKESVTGYMYEPWHIRYLGVKLATGVYNSGLTLEEYLGIDSHY